MKQTKASVSTKTRAKAKNSLVRKSLTKVEASNNSKKKTTIKELETRLGKAQRQIMGSKADAQGLRYEQNVANYFRNKGWDIQERYKKYKYEYDIYGLKDTTGTGDYKYLIVECKDKKRVTAKDVLHFFAKTHIFSKHIPEDFIDSSIPLDAYLCYTDEIDKDAIASARASKPRLNFYN